MRKFWLEDLGVILFSCLITLIITFFLLETILPWPINAMGPATIALITIGACSTDICMSLFSLSILRRLGHVGAGRGILASIPVFNILIAIWLILSIRDPIELPRGMTPRPIQHVLPFSTTESVKISSDPAEALFETNESRQPSGATASVIVNLAKQAYLGTANPRRKSVWWNFLAGSGSSLEFFPPPERIDHEQTDAESFAQDWEAVANDMWNAIGSYELDTPAVDPAKEWPIQEQRDAPSQ